MTYKTLSDFENNITTPAIIEAKNIKPKNIIKVSFKDKGEHNNEL